MKSSKTKSTENSASKKGVAKATHSRARATENREEPKDEGKLMEFFLHELKDLYWAEKHLVEELETMAEEATSEELRDAFMSHRTETEEHVQRLENVFSILGHEPEEKKCEAIAGITKEVKEIVGDTEDDTYTRDVALIVGAQKVEHYEIATYGSLVQLAKTLGHGEVADILEETLNEEKDADDTLTSIAESFVNEEATTETEESEEE